MRHSIHGEVIRDRDALSILVDGINQFGGQAILAPYEGRFVTLTIVDSPADEPEKAVAPTALLFEKQVKKQLVTIEKLQKELAASHAMRRETETQKTKLMTSRNTWRKLALTLKDVLMATAEEADFE